MYIIKVTIKKSGNEPNDLVNECKNLLMGYVHCLEKRDGVHDRFINMINYCLGLSNMLFLNDGDNLNIIHNNNIGLLFDYTKITEDENNIYVSFYHENEIYLSDRALIKQRYLKYVISDDNKYNIINIDFGNVLEVFEPRKRLQLPNNMIEIVIDKGCMNIYTHKDLESGEWFLKGDNNISAKFEKFEYKLPKINDIDIYRIHDTYIDDETTKVYLNIKS